MREARIIIEDDGTEIVLKREIVLWAGMIASNALEEHGIDIVAEEGSLNRYLELTDRREWARYANFVGLEQDVLALSDEDAAVLLSMCVLWIRECLGASSVAEMTRQGHSMSGLSPN